MISKLKLVFAMLNSWFTFFLGLVFIFGIGLIYAYLQPEDLWLKAVFLVIALGWVAFTIKYIWDVMEKRSKSQTENPPSQVTDTTTSLSEGQDIEQKETTP